MLTVKHISSGAGQRGLASLVAADRHEHLSSSQPLCCPRQKICRWLSASHQADGSGVVTCWFTKVWSTHTNYRRQRALTTSIWWAMRAIVSDMWKQRERAACAARRGGSGAAEAAGAARSPRPPRALPALPGPDQTFSPHGEKASSQTQAELEGSEAVSRDGLVVFPHCCCTRCKETLRDGGFKSDGKC